MTEKLRVTSNRFSQPSLSFPILQFLYELKREGPNKIAIRMIVPAMIIATSSASGDVMAMNMPPFNRPDDT